jgi:hypothetical protein
LKYLASNTPHTSVWTKVFHVLGIAKTKVLCIMVLNGLSKHLKAFKIMVLANTTILFTVLLELGKYGLSKQA